MEIRNSLTTELSNLGEKCLHLFIVNRSQLLFCKMLLGAGRDSVKAILGDDALSNVPILILANKIDKHASAGEDEIRSFFSLHALTTGKVVSLFLIACPALFFVCFIYVSGSITV